MAGKTGRMHCAPVEGERGLDLDYEFRILCLAYRLPRGSRYPCTNSLGSWQLVLRVSYQRRSFGYVILGCLVLHCAALRRWRVGKKRHAGPADRKREGERQECLLYDNDRDMESGEQKWSSSRSSTTCLSIPPARLPNQAGDWVVRALRFVNPCC
jgi:hypothetical protein